MSAIVGFVSSAQDEWRSAFSELAPEFELSFWPDIGAAENVSYALVNEPPPGVLRTFPNLKAIFSVGAGVDAILRDGLLPENVPVFRAVSDDVPGLMADYVLAAVLFLHLGWQRHLQDRAVAGWHPVFGQVSTDERSVLLLGLGMMGSAVASKLTVAGFRVSAWSRIPKKMAGIETFAATTDIREIARGADTVVNLLPLTGDTCGVLNASLFAALPAGASVINVGRGEHLIDEDLLQALDSGHLSGAVLDVFREEPLPASHAFWMHPSVFMTPHTAGVSSRHARARNIVSQIGTFEAGGSPAFPVDRGLGY